MFTKETVTLTAFYDAFPTESAKSESFDVTLYNPCLNEGVITLTGPSDRTITMFEPKTFADISYSI